MSPEERRGAILDLARQKRELTVEEIADQFHVSRETARRDLAYLDDRGLLRRVHGGAMQPKTASESAFRSRLSENADAKRRIANAAARLFEEHDTVMIDSGSTTEALAVALAGANRLTVITNSVRIATLLWGGGANHRIHVLGGEFHGESGQMVGSLCIEQIAGFRADHAVLGVGAIDTMGNLMNFDVEEALIARAMIKYSRRVTVLADHSKFGRVALVKTCTLDDVARVVTDMPLTETIGRMMALNGVEVIIAS